jgi:hypothetical protein
MNVRTLLNARHGSALAKWQPFAPLEEISPDFVAM